MSVAKSSSGGTGFLSNDSVEDSSLHPIYGVAIGANDVTVGNKSGKRKLWTPEVLEGSGGTLAGKEIVVDHENRNSREVVGEVTDARFKDGVGVIYKGVIDDSELATKIEHGWLEVSPRIIHSKEMEERDGLSVPKSVRKFDNLSIVVRGASPSNSVNIGEPEELMSVEELQSAFDSDDSVVEEYQDFEGQVDMEKYMYPTEEGAEGAAQGLGCSGSHRVEVNGEDYFMPCESRDEFLNSLSETQENESSENSENSDEELETLGISEGDMVQWRAIPAVGKVVAIDEERNVAMVSVYKGGEDTDVAVTAGFEDIIPMSEVDEMSKHTEEMGDYSKEEMQTASLMASQTKMTKKSALKLLSNLNPMRGTDARGMGEMLAKAMEYEECEKMMDEMSKHMDSEMGSNSGNSDDGGSMLNSIIN